MPTRIPGRRAEKKLSEGSDSIFRGDSRPGRPIQTNPIRYASRWIIERTNAWLQNYRRVLVPHERLLTTYRAFVVFPCVMITLGTLLR